MKKLHFVILMICFIVPSVTLATFGRDLQYGSTGDDVAELQEFLTVQGNYMGPITGNFYSLTRQGLISFQTVNNISPAAGYFGPITRAKVNSTLASQETASNAQAIQETGATTTPSKNDTTTALQAQINALLVQLQQLNAQVQTQTTIQQQTQSTLQKTQQNVQQIQQNTTLVPYVPPPAPQPQYQWSTNITKSRVSKLADGNTYLDVSMTPTYKVSKDGGGFNDGREPIIITIAPNEGLGDPNGFILQPVSRWVSGLRSEIGFSAMKNGIYHLTFTAEGSIHTEDVVVNEL